MIEKPESIYLKFENLVAEILLNAGYQIVRKRRQLGPLKRGEYVPDILALKDRNLYFIEVKLYRYRQGIINLAEAVKILSITSITNVLDVLDLYDDIRKLTITNLNTRQNFVSNVDVIGIKGLRALALPNPQLAAQLEEFLIENQLPHSQSADEEEISTAIVDAFEKDKPEHKGQKIIDEISALKKGKSGWRQFEQLGKSALEYLFAPALVGWHEQKITTDGLNKFDLVCRINSAFEEKDNFWAELSHDCNTRFVIFEFKNYDQKIKQGEIYTTEKYLFVRALRNVAFIIARSGYEKNALSASLGTLRESGKIIILLTEEDLFEMLRKKDENLEPTELLRSKLDELFITLPK